MPAAHSFEPTRVLFGAAYYAEYHTSDRTEEDLDLMAAAGFSVIRVGESVWSTWEPREGVFDLDWLEPVLDGAHRRGIRVILGTPTYAAPPWLQTAYPEIAGERETGRRIPWGSRQEMDFTHPAFRYFAERIIRKVVGRYAGHPAVVGFQVDNEPGLELFHNHGTFTRFVRRLERRYGDVDTLNREWGLTYWSHRIADWSELWAPDGNTLPQYDLEWRRFQAELTTEFIGWQADIVREYSHPNQFVTTCLAYPRPAVDDRSLTQSLDITAGNPYYAMQDHLDLTKHEDAQTPWTTSGVGGFFRQADRLFSSKQKRFLVTETNAQSIGTSFMNLPPWPGQLRAAALGLISRGAAMIEYWHWHTLPYGTEMYWGGVLPHSLKPGRIYEEVAEIGHLLERVGTALDGYVPDADVALLWSNDSRWALEFFPPLSNRGEPDRQSYEHIFDAFHGGVIESGAQARILHAEQAVEIGGAALAQRYPTLVVPALYVADDRMLDLLGAYAHAGGHLVLGPRTAYADHLARARVAVAPDRLTDASGVHYDEYSNLEAPIGVASDVLQLQEDAAATGWVDGLIADGAEQVVSYRHPHFGGFPAVTTKAHGSGRVTVVGTVPSRSLSAALARWAVPNRVADELASDASAPVTVSSGRLPDGSRAWFLINWSGDEQRIELLQTARDAGDGTELSPDAPYTLPAWSSRILLTEHSDHREGDLAPSTTTEREGRR
ncbi:beta-galactosidase [Rathayibacter sp. KR2-224]|uniref:beta-galactosidase n=1 Tax=Rathayibacter sp. KR2-224 TaxID=3400913 RepID=UPI003C12A7E4